MTLLCNCIVRGGTNNNTPTNLSNNLTIKQTMNQPSHWSCEFILLTNSQPSLIPLPPFSLPSPSPPPPSPSLPSLPLSLPSLPLFLPLLTNISPPFTTLCANNDFVCRFSRDPKFLLDYCGIQFFRGEYESGRYQIIIHLLCDPLVWCH